jgi:prephenate dehydratase
LQHPHLKGETNMEKTLGYLGPPGTFSHEAALNYCKGRACRLKPFAAIKQIFAATANKTVDAGIVPVENSLEGSLNLTFDLLAGNIAVKIKGELHCRVKHCLLAPPGLKIEGIERVYSHPQALAQCRRYLEKILPKAAPIAATSTTDAALQVAQNNNRGAAIASQRAAELYRLAILQENIQDGPGENKTRFLLLAPEDASATGRDKTSLLLTLPDRPGALYAALGIFARHNLNLTKIESRPVRGNLGKYIFFLDVTGHRKDAGLAGALLETKEKNIKVKILGSYPRAENCE